jgi:hypothetical protein
MRKHSPAFPFFIPVAVRLPTDNELALVRYIVDHERAQYLPQLPDLKVVGRCGCGACPTVFFKIPNDQPERDIAVYAGRDATGGLTGVALMQNAEQLSQLEFFSVDGHDPWGAPSVATLAPL